MSGPPDRGALRRQRRAKRVVGVPLPLAAIPRATYRVQLNRDFTFANLTALVPYLARLGISHVYCSPYLRARPGSAHGYDIVDHGMLNPEIGTLADFRRLVAALDEAGMSHLCDVVPNHMAVMGKDNAWWLDVLENGPASVYAEYFDIDWSPRDSEVAGKVLVPVLGAPYGEVLDRGELALDFDPDTATLFIAYFDHRFPLDPSGYARVLLPSFTQLRARMSSLQAARARRALAKLSALPARDDPRPQRVAERRRVIAEQKRRLAQLAREEPAVARAITSAVARLRERALRDELHALLEAQAYRLAFWRVASDEINYRRFFDINELAGLRMHRDDVFDATHDFVLRFAAEGGIGGLRIDHPDGLFDPARYCARLQKRYREHWAATSRAGGGDRGIYVVLEKILAPHERLPVGWPVHGTTGYRFANLVNGLFVDRRAKVRVDRVWRAFAGAEAGTFEAEAYRGKRAIMERPLASELAMLTSRAMRIARADRRTRDFTFNTLRVAIREVVAQFPVYRTYVDEGAPSAQDRRYVEWAVARARARSRTTDAQVFDFLRVAFLGLAPAGSEALAVPYREFAMRAQQFTAPVAAKGVEDTAFYTFNRLVSLNEVGGDPEQFGTSMHAFHRVNKDRAAAWPHAMLATSTHDNKRSEDVRARIDVISERPALWSAIVARWSRLHRSRIRSTEDGPAPSRNDQYLLYQTLVGTFPPERMGAPALERYSERLVAYMVKAAREGKVRTSWLTANAAYEDALCGFVRDLLSGPDGHPFLEDLRAQSAYFAWFGLLNSVSMMLLKVAAPGVPDFYQGTELVDDSLVDPDNRRPVHYETRKATLAALAVANVDAAFLASLFAAPLDGRAKLWTIARALALRREHAALFALGDYRPLRALGPRAGHVVAFARTYRDLGVICVAGRLFASLGPDVGEVPRGAAWQGASLDVDFLPAGTRLVNALSGTQCEAGAGPLPLESVFDLFPGALLHYTLPRGEA